MDSILEFDDLQQRLSSEINFTDDNNNDDSSVKEDKDKYSLRPRSMRRQTEIVREHRLEQASKLHKPKQKAAPLSKYRRKTANARERNRMREINQAFETLRRVIPHMQVPTQTNVANEKLTKITTLRLAMKYISALSSALNQEGNINSSSLNERISTDLDCLLLESDGESLSLSEHSGSILASPDFLEPSLSPVDFSDPSLPALLHTDFTEHALEPSDFSDFLLT